MAAFPSDDPNTCYRNPSNTVTSVITSSSCLNSNGNEMLVIVLTVVSLSCPPVRWKHFAFKIVGSLPINPALLHHLLPVSVAADLTLNFLKNISHVRLFQHDDVAVVFLLDKRAWKYHLPFLLQTKIRIAYHIAIIVAIPPAKGYCIAWSWVSDLKSVLKGSYL